MMLGRPKQLIATFAMLLGAALVAPAANADTSPAASPSSSATSAGNSTGRHRIAPLPPTPDSPRPAPGSEGPPQVKALKQTSSLPSCAAAASALRAAKGKYKAAPCWDPSIHIVHTDGLEPDPNWDDHPEFCQKGKQVLYSRLDECLWGEDPFGVVDTKGEVIGSGIVEWIASDAVGTATPEGFRIFKIRTIAAEGEALGAQISAINNCYGTRCLLTNINPPPNVDPPVKLGQPYRGRWDFKVDPVNKDQYWTYLFGSVVIHKDGWIKNAEITLPQSTRIRCDRVFDKTGGCVLPEFAPDFSLSLSDTDPKTGVSEAAQHIKDAQQSTRNHWGRRSDGKILTRLWDAEKADQNRKAACPPSRPRPPGKSCDEYPFRATYQGAALLGAGDFSVRDINENHNSNAGSDLGTFYQVYRFLDGDGFWVRIDP